MFFGLLLVVEDRLDGSMSSGKSNKRDACYVTETYPLRLDSCCVWNDFLWQSLSAMVSLAAAANRNTIASGSTVGSSVHAQSREKEAKAH